MLPMLILIAVNEYELYTTTTTTGDLGLIIRAATRAYANRLVTARDIAQGFRNAEAEQAEQVKP